MSTNIRFVDRSQRLNIGFQGERVIEKDYTQKYIPQRITLTIGTQWSNTSPYIQTVTLSGYEVTPNTKVDLDCSGGVLSILHACGTYCLYITNDNGTLTATALGGRPGTAITVQATVYETNTQ